MNEPNDIGELYKRVAPALFRRSRSLLFNDDEAQDIVHESFVRYLNAGYTKGSPFAVLYRIATNLSIDRLRRRGRVKTESVEDQNLKSQGSVEGQVQSALDLAMLTKGLDPRYLQVGVLYHVDGYTQDEVARSLGLSRRSVGKSLKQVEKHMQQRAARLGYSTPLVSTGAS